jgi:polar amino acid transport system substrate-binding protein
MNIKRALISVSDKAGVVEFAQQLGSLDTIAPAVKKGDKELLAWVNTELETLGKENFIHKAYDATLKPAYGDSIDPEAIVVEGGKLK